MSLTFQKKDRLLTRRDYRRVSFYNSRQVGKFMVLETRPGLAPRLGITATKQYGKAHLRNHFKRRLREIFRLNKNSLPALDVVVKPRTLAKNASFDLLLTEFIFLIHAAESQQRTETSSHG